MKNKLYKLTVIIFLILIFIKKDIMYTTIYETTLIWFKNIVPNLFPMFIITSYIINSNLIFNICNILGNTFKKIFNTSIYGVYVFILSLFTGSPSNAKYIKDLLDNNLISKNESNKLLLFTLNYNPILILTLLNQYLQKNTSYLILLIIILSNVILGLLNRNIKYNIPTNKYNIKKNALSIIIKNTIDTLLMILGTLIFFNILLSLIPINNIYIKNIVNGFLEITTALKDLKNINFNYNIKVLLSTIYLSFGSLSIHMQIKSILPDTNYKLFLKNKLISIIISIIILLLVHKMGLI